MVLIVAISVSLEAMFVEFVEILDALVEMLEVFVLISDSTSVMVPRASVPSMSASLRIATVPEV